MLLPLLLPLPRPFPPDPEPPPSPDAGAALVLLDPDRLDLSEPDLEVWRVVLFDLREEEEDLFRTPESLPFVGSLMPLSFILRTAAASLGAHLLFLNLSYSLLDMGP